MLCGSAPCSLSRRRSAAIRRSIYPQVQALEARVLPSGVWNWTGQVSSDWFNKANWTAPFGAKTQIPGPEDEVWIDGGRNPCAILPGKGPSPVVVDYVRFPKGTVEIGAGMVLQPTSGWNQGRSVLTGQGELLLVGTTPIGKARPLSLLFGGSTMEGGGVTVIKNATAQIWDIGLTLSNWRVEIRGAVAGGPNGNLAGGLLSWVGGGITLSHNASIQAQNNGTFSADKDYNDPNAGGNRAVFTADGTGTVEVWAGGTLQNNDTAVITVHPPVILNGAGARVVVVPPPFAGLLSVDYLSLYDGVVIGRGSFQVNDRFVNGPAGSIGWGQEDVGQFTLATGCLSLLSNLWVVGGWQVHNYGTAVLSGGTNFGLRNGSKFFNEPSGAFYIVDGSGIQGDSNAQFVNKSLFKKTGGAKSTIDVPFVSISQGGARPATIQQVNSTLHFAKNPALDASVITQDPDVLQSDEPFVLNGSTLEGAGNNVFEGDLVNNGYVQPGGPFSAGGLSVEPNPDDPYGTGNYDQNGYFDVDIGGTVPINTYDQLNITGTAQLGGTLVVDTINGYWPTTAGQTYVIMTFASRVGTFDNLVLPSPAPGVTLHFTVQYNSTNVTLVVVNSPFPSPPAVTGVSPNSGPAAGGTSVTITGTNFTNVYMVTFGDVGAASFTVGSSTQITAVSPPEMPGTVDIHVWQVGGVSPPTSADQFTFISGPDPAVTRVWPSLGSDLGGTVVTISGSGFTGATAVTFGSTAAEKFQVNSDSSITALSPPGSGSVDVRVTNESGTSAIVSGDGFTYLPVPPPVLSGIGPLTGGAGGGTWVNITGSNFDTADGVFFGNEPAAQFTIVSPTLISAQAPPGVAGTVDITVTADGNASAILAGDRFTYTGVNGPSVTSISPVSGAAAGGTVVTIDGSGFTGASAVLFGGVAATNFAVLSDSVLTAVAPTGTVGTADVTVVTAAGTSATVSADQFTYLSGSAPTVSSLSITSGTSGGGQVLTVMGTAFTGTTAVSFGSVAAIYFTVLSDTMLIAVAPPQAAGVVDLRVTTPSGTSATGSGDHFTYTAAPAPTVSAVTTNSGTTPGGTTVVITGSGFTGASAVNFGSVPAQAFSVNSDSSITAVAPAGVAGTVDITVTTPSGTSATGSADHFTYTLPPLPAVSLISQSSGSSSGGTLLFLSGSGFTGATAVNFGSMPVPDFTVNSDTLITVLDPPQGVGTFDITVTSPGGTSAAVSADRFSMTQAATPSVTGLDTTSGSTGGGGWITISGSGFTGAFNVAFGAVPVTEFYVSSDSSISALVPPQAAGTVDVTVTTWTGTSAVAAADQYTYTSAGAPTVTGLATATGTTAGGTLVTITGSGFTGASSVSFGSVLAVGYTVNSDTSISVYAPPQAAGTVDVKVTTPSGTSATSAADRFTYSNAAAPSVTAITPSGGTTPGGTVVTIVGSGFTGATGVRFGSVAGSSFTVNSDTSITAVSPPEAAGTVHVTVTTYSGTSVTSAADQFTYTNITQPAPSVTTVGPNTGYTAGGETVTITGQYFTGATSVTFGGVAAAFTINSDTSITATSPSNTAGQAAVQVITNNSPPHSPPVTSVYFTYITTPVAHITSLSPNTGTTAGGTSVTINGTSFVGVSAVMFGSVAATSFAVNSSTHITATAPPQAAGVVGVTVITASGTSPAANYTYTTAPLPTISSLSTGSGSTAGGTLVTITGTNFSGATGVSFGGGRPRALW